MPSGPKQIQEEGSGITLAAHESPALHCVPCSRLIPTLTENPIMLELAGRPMLCPSCAKPVDVRSHLLTWLAMPGVGLSFFNLPIGVQTTRILFKIRHNESITIDAHKHGVPADAVVLARHYNSHDDWPGDAHIYPNEVHGPQGGRVVRDGKWRVFGRGEGPGPFRPTPAECSVSITWTPRSWDRPGWDCLATAFRMFADRNFEGAIVPACGAVEVSLGATLNQFFVERVRLSKDNIRSFMRDAAFGHQLNVILPMLLHLTDRPPITEKLRNELKALKDARNVVAHGSGVTAGIDQATAAKHLVAAVYGFQLMRMVHYDLFQNEGETPQPD